jgi:hypothetical protein
MGEQLQRGVGEKAPTGHKIVSKEIARVIPGDGKQVPSDHILLDVLVKDEQGNSWKAPLTLNRSTDPSDPVKSIPVDDLVKHLTGIASLAGDSRINQTLVALGQQAGGSWSSAGDGMLYNSADGQSKQMEGYQPKVLTQKVANGMDEDLYTSRDNGESWQTANVNGSRLADAPSGGNGSPPSWEQLVNQVAKDNGISPDRADAALRADEQFKSLAPALAEPASSVSEQSPGASSESLSIEERSSEVKLEKAKQEVANKGRQAKRDADKKVDVSLSKIEGKLKRMRALGGIYAGSTLSDQERQQMRKEAKQIFEDPNASEKAKNRALKLYNQLDK